MRILSTEQIRKWDAFTIEHEPIASIDLMERASRTFVDWFYLKFDHTHTVTVVCGTGNNGGDGLAAARMLYDWRYAVKVFVVNAGGTPSADFSTNLKRLPEGLECHEITADHEIRDFDDCDVLIDALFGSGLSRPVEGLHARVIDAINNSRAVKVAVDIPSGLMADKPTTGAVVKADYTVSFQRPKLAFFLPDSGGCVGEWKVVDIGLHRDYIRQVESPYTYLRPRQIRRILHRRKKHDHKGTYGHALLIAGSYGKMGAAILAARAALRAGVGLLTTHIPECGFPIMQTAVPEAMALADDDARVFSSPPATGSYTAVGIGPGLGRDSRTVKALSVTLEAYARPMVLDADALNIIAENPDFFSRIPEGSILTPHPKEFERLVGSWSHGFERLEKQRELAQKLKCVVLVKGAYTSVVGPDGAVYFNSTGNPGMATGGTGDVLTGILTGLLAQNYSPVEAAISGVFLHGLAGDMAKVELGEDGLIASDVVDQLPAAFLKIRRT